MVKEKIKLTEQQKKIMRGEVCPYCKKPSEYVDSSVIYGKSYGMIYYCKNDGAFVGVHKGTDKALGRLANPVLRILKVEAHAAFDKLWKSGKMKRKQAYAWLSKELGLPKQYTHIGMFSEKTCEKVIKLCKSL